MVEISQKILKTYMYLRCVHPRVEPLVYIRNRVVLFCSKISCCKQELLQLLPLVEAQVLHIDRARDRLFTLQSERQKNVWKLVQVAVRTETFLVITDVQPVVSYGKIQMTSSSSSYLSHFYMGSTYGMEAIAR